MRIAIILGTRPEIVKCSPIVRECDRLELDFFILHTGQHYSYLMDKVFFEQLELPLSKFNLDVGSGNHGKQTGAMLTGIEKVLLTEHPDVVLVEGDTNTVLAGAIAAVKLGIKVGHVEAGLRSYDRHMPEEINRILTDHCSDYLFAPTEKSKEILLHEGIDADNVFMVGNTVVDAVHQNLGIAKSKSKALESLGVEPGKFILATAHRAENVDDKERFSGLIAGLQPADLVVVAGRPSMGKTSFSLSIAEHVAIEEKVPVAIFTLEMSNMQLTYRMLCSRARISSNRMRAARLPDHEWPKLSIAAGALSGAKIFLDDSASIGILEMRAKARRLKAREGIGLIIVDYLQLMRGPKGAENRQQEISMISRALKGLAKDLNVPVLALSQLSRAVEQRGGDKKPLLADLRESGAIEQDADIVMFIYRPEVYEISKMNVYGEQVDSKGLAEIRVSKHRNGLTGSIFLSFLEDYARFETSERYHKDFFE